jgi:hypothetical protein
MSMTSLAILAVTSLFALLPQDPPAETPPAPPSAQGKEPILDANAHKALRGKLQTLLAADEEYQNALGTTKIDKVRKLRLRAKEDFEGEWDKYSKRGNLLASVADLRAIYDNCFEVAKPEKGVGTMRDDRDKFGDKEFAWFYYLPKKYKQTVPMPTVVLLPGLEAAGKRADGRRYFEATWKDAAAADSAIFHIPVVPDQLELDPVPDLARDGQEALEQDRIESVWRGFGQTIRTANIDRPRVFLDCGKGSSAFGVRFASIFPDRFAGLVLRHPTAIEGIRLGSLRGMPVLMIKTAETAAAVEALQPKLETLTPGSVTVIEATDAYPFAAASDAVFEWMGKQRRDMMRAKVLIEPNHNRFKNAYWVEIRKMNPIHGTAAENMPRIEVTAERESNRIVVKATGIEQFALRLNDDLVDLEKEFTLVVNDKATTHKLTRDESYIYDYVRQRRDWDCLFPVVLTTSVPK